jgi:peptidoglycan hydrolase-like protein with peptidoglycan-binding domain
MVDINPDLMSTKKIIDEIEKNKKDPMSEYNSRGSSLKHEYDERIKESNRIKQDIEKAQQLQRQIAEFNKKTGNELDTSQVNMNTTAKADFRVAQERLQNNIEKYRRDNLDVTGNSDFAGVSNSAQAIIDDKKTGIVGTVIAAAANEQKTPKTNSEFQNLVEKKKQLVERVNNDEGITVQNMDKLSPAEVELKKVNQRIAELLPEYKQNNAVALQNANSNEAKLVASATDKNPELNKDKLANNKPTTYGSGAANAGTPPTPVKEDDKPKQNSVVDDGEGEKKDAKRFSKELFAKGRADSTVKTLQEGLGLEADGIYGDKTKKAVEKFQKENKIGVDGIVGEVTKKKLESMGINLGGVHGGNDANFDNTAQDLPNNKSSQQNKQMGK